MLFEPRLSSSPQPVERVVGVVVALVEAAEVGSNNGCRSRPFLSCRSPLKTGIDHVLRRRLQLTLRYRSEHRAVGARADSEQSDVWGYEPRRTACP